MHSFTEAEAKKVQGEDLGSASKDLFDAIKKGDYPKWDFFVQIMSDDEHAELDLGPARRHEDLARRPVPAAQARHHDAQPQRGDFYTGSVETHPAKAGDLLMMAKQPDSRYATSQPA